VAITITWPSLEKLRKALAIYRCFSLIGMDISNPQLAKIITNLADSSYREWNKNKVRAPYYPFKRERERS